MHRNSFARIPPHELMEVHLAVFKDQAEVAGVGEEEVSDSYDILMTQCLEQRCFAELSGWYSFFVGIPFHLFDDYHLRGCQMLCEIDHAVRSFSDIVGSSVQRLHIVVVNGIWMCSAMEVEDRTG